MSDTMLDDLEALEAQAAQRSAVGMDASLLEEVEIDVSDAQPQDFSPVPPAKYPVEISKLEAKISGAGNRYLELEFTICVGEFQNRKVWDRVMLSGKGKARFVVLIAAIDMYDATNKKFRGRFADLLGKKLWANLKIEGERVVAQNDGTSKTYPPRNVVDPWTESFEHMSTHAVPARTVVPSDEQALLDAMDVNGIGGSTAEEIASGEEQVAEVGESELPFEVPGEEPVAEEENIEQQLEEATQEAVPEEEVVAEEAEDEDAEMARLEAELLARKAAKKNGAAPAAPKKAVAEPATAAAARPSKLSAIAADEDAPPFDPESLDK